LGGVCVGLIAPAVFTTLLEWPIGLAFSFLLALAVLALAGASPKARPAYNVAAMLAPPIVVLAVLFWQAGQVRPLDSARNFYGAVSVWEQNRDDPKRHQFLLKHGRITHGQQYANPPERGRATMYYRPPSGAAHAISYCQTGIRQGKRGQSPFVPSTLRAVPANGDSPLFPCLRVGVVGLGVGTLAAYARPGDVYRFYEINPAIADFAERYFTYLEDARGRGATCEVVMGDARLSLQEELPQDYDLLVLDAFSGDSIPIHLLTREAFEVYLRHLAPGGVLAVQITNRSLCLAPVVRKLAEHFGMDTVRIYTAGEEGGTPYRSDWMLLLSESADFFCSVPSCPPPGVDDDFDVPLWTDQFNNLFQILKEGD
jgi:hypothetical protein